MHRIVTLAVLCAALGCAGGPAAPADRAEAANDAATAPLALSGLDGSTVDVDAELAAGRNVVLVFWQVW